MINVEITGEKDKNGAMNIRSDYSIFAPMEKD